MYKASFLVFVFVVLTVSPALAATEFGTVTSVGKDEFTIKSSLTNEELTFKIGDELKQGRNFHGGKLAELKKGVRVHLRAMVKNGSYVCTAFVLIGSPMGPCEIDFSPLLVGDSVPPCSVHVRAGSEKGGNELHGSINEAIVYSAPTKVATIRDDIERMFSQSGWKVRAVGDEKLLVQSYKDSVIVGLTVKAEGLPKEHQPRVKSVTPPKKENGMK